MYDYKIAFYRGRKSVKGIMPIIFRALDSLTRTVTKGPYSHCEVVKVLPTGETECFSSSYRDGGVRSKILSLDSDSWDLVDAPYLTAEAVEEVKRKTVGLKYDLVGAVGVVILSPNRPHKWFCSELPAEVIGLKEPWRFSPNTLYSVVQRLEKDNG